MVLSFHQQNIRFIAIEMFKVFKGISPQIVKETFQFRDAVPYQLKKTIFMSYLCPYCFSSTESIKVLGLKIWEILPHEIK